MVARKPFHAILKEVSDKTKFEDRVELLQRYDSPALRTLLKYTFDPKVKWLLPKGPLPEGMFKPSEFDEPLRMYGEIKRLYLFVEGGNPNLKQERREFLFIELLNCLEKEEGELLIACKDKTTPYSNITEKLVKKAFPDLL